MTRTSRRSRWAPAGAMLAVVPVLLLSGSCSGPQRAEHSGSTPPAAARPGLSGPVGPVARSCQGVAITAAQESAEGSAEATRLAIKRIDKAAAKGVIHKNAAARKKSRLTKRLAALSAER